MHNTSNRSSLVPIIGSKSTVQEGHLEIPAEYLRQAGMEKFAAAFWDSYSPKMCLIIPKAALR
eukprot:4246342-Amphidinium_carterae.1